MSCTLPDVLRWPCQKERDLDQDGKLSPAVHPPTCLTSPSLPLRDIQGVWVEGKRGQKRKSKKDIKIDPAVKGDKGCLACHSSLTASLVFRLTETVQAKYQLFGDQPRSWWPLRATSSLHLLLSLCESCCHHISLMSPPSSPGRNLPCPLEQACPAVMPSPALPRQVIFSLAAPMVQAAWSGPSAGLVPPDLAPATSP